jgi:hypothetical protein
MSGGKDHANAESENIGHEFVFPQAYVEYLERNNIENP